MQVKSRIFYSKRNFTSEPHTGKTREPVWNFVEILKVMAKWR